MHDGRQCTARRSPERKELDKLWSPGSQVDRRRVRCDQSLFRCRFSVSEHFFLRRRRDWCLRRLRLGRDWLCSRRRGSLRCGAARANKDEQPEYKGQYRQSGFQIHGISLNSNANPTMNSSERSRDSLTADYSRFDRFYLGHVSARTRCRTCAGGRSTCIQVVVVGAIIASLSSLSQDDARIQ
jgi:hypothetical protein